MGDDLTCHVKSLSEDKARLAYMLAKFEAQVGIFFGPKFSYLTFHIFRLWTALSWDSFIDS